MKRLAKRKMFLMSMAVAVSLPAGAFAKGSDKAEGNGHSRGERGASISAPVDEIQEPPEMRLAAEGGSLFDKLKGLAQGLAARPEATSEKDRDKSWKLELLQEEPVRLGLSDNPRTTAARPLGVALRLKF